MIHTYTNITSKSAYNNRHCLQKKKKKPSVKSICVQRGSGLDYREKANHSVHLQRIMFWYKTDVWKC